MCNIECLTNANKLHSAATLKNQEKKKEKRFKLKHSEMANAFAGLDKTQPSLSLHRGTADVIWGNN